MRRALNVFVADVLLTLWDVLLWLRCERAALAVGMLAWRWLGRL
jgi:hypothetical protein